LGIENIASFFEDLQRPVGFTVNGEGLVVGAFVYDCKGHVNFSVSV